MSSSTSSDAGLIVFPVIVTFEFALFGLTFVAVPASAVPAVTTLPKLFQ